MRSSPTYWPASSSSSSLASSRSSSSTLVHDAAYLPDGPVSPAQLPALVAGKITQPVIDYLVDRVCDAVDFGLGRPSSSSTSLLSKRSRSNSRRWQSSERAAFTEFSATVLRRAEVTLPGVIGALVYIDRSRPHLSIAIEEWAHHRVFLGSLITASKYLNDASLKNAHWAMCTGVFGRRDVQRIEREFLEVLDWELAVTEADLVRVCTSMVREGALVRPVVKSVEPVVVREIHMEVDGIAEKNTRNGSLQTAHALWQLRPHNRPEKRAQADVDMDVDEFAAERARRRRGSYASPTSSETCSTCTVNSSPDTDSDDSNSPRTPPSPHSAQRGHYAVPGSTEKPTAHPMHAKSVSNGSMSFQPFALLDAFPAVPAPPALGPTPSIAISPAFVPGSVQMPGVPPPLPSLPPYAAFPLTRAFPGSHPHLTQRPHSSRPASPYAKVLLPTVHGTGSRSRPVTPYSHRRSSAISTAPSLYPAYLPTVNV